MFRCDARRGSAMTVPLASALLLILLVMPAPAAAPTVGPERVLGRETARGGHINAATVRRSIVLPATLRFRAVTTSRTKLFGLAELTCTRADRDKADQPIVRLVRFHRRSPVTGTVPIPRSGWDRGRPCRLVVLAGFRNRKTKRGLERLGKRRATVTVWGRSLPPEVRVAVLPWDGEDLRGPDDVPRAVPAPARAGSALEVENPSDLQYGFRGRRPMKVAPTWQRCDGAGANCVDLPIATWRYTPTVADIGARLRVVVTATNADGSARAAVVPSEPVVAADAE